MDIKLANISMSVMKKKFQTNPLDHLDHSLQGDILKLEALGEEKKNKHKARNETSSFRWSNSLVEVELPDQVFSLHPSNLPISGIRIGIGGAGGSGQLDIRLLLLVQQPRRSDDGRKSGGFLLTLSCVSSSSSSTSL